MRKPEQLLWDTMKRNLQKNHDIYAERIENAVGEGTPDVLLKARRQPGCASNPTPFFVELKVGIAPKRDTTPIFGKRGAGGVRKSQENWHLKWHDAGGISFVLARIKGREPRELFLFRGALAPRINEFDWNNFCYFAEPAHTWPQIFDLWRKL